MTVQPLQLADAAALETYRSGDPTLLVGIAEGAVRRFCGWHIAPSITETVTLDSPGTNTLLLPSMHVTAVSAVRGITMDDPAGYSMGLYGEGNYGDPPVVLDGWRTNPSARFRSGILEHSPYRWPMGIVEVDFTHGYDTVPAEVQGVVLDLAETLRNSMGAASRRSVGSVSVDFAADQITPVHQQVLDAYKIPAVP